MKNIATNPCGILSLAISMVIGSAGLGAVELERAAPESVSMSSQGLAALKARMTELISSGQRAGIVYAIASVILSATCRWNPTQRFVFIRKVAR
jgi:hypothetical protein